MTCPLLFCQTRGKLANVYPDVVLHVWGLGGICVRGVWKVLVCRGQGHWADGRSEEVLESSGAEE